MIIFLKKDIDSELHNIYIKSLLKVCEILFCPLIYEKFWEGKDKKKYIQYGVKSKNLIVSERAIDRNEIHKKYLPWFELFLKTNIGLS